MASPPPKGTFWIPVPGGCILAGPHPVTASEGLADRIHALTRDVGITHFVDLSSSDDWMPSYRDLLPPGCFCSRYEIGDRRLPPDLPGLRAIVHEMLDEAAEGRLTYMHCQAGLGRTGTVAGVLLREIGHEGQEALDELMRLRLAAGLHHGSPELEEQFEFVRRWSAGR